MRDLKQSKHLIAYIDLLGTTDSIQKNGDDDLLQLLHRQYEAALYLTKQENEFWGRLKVKIFSDNVLFCIEIRDDFNLLSTYNLLSAFLKFYLRGFVEQGILFRGGITVGDVYIDDLMVWGTGLVEAVYMEEHISVYPRVVIDNDLLSALVPDQTRENMLVQIAQCFFIDTDGLACFDYFEHGSQPLSDIWLELAREHNNTQVEATNNVKVLQKRLWFNHYLDIVSARNDYMKNVIESLPVPNKQSTNAETKE